jgi:hypothetical protein
LWCARRIQQQCGRHVWSGRLAYAVKPGFWGSAQCNFTAVGYQDRGEGFGNGCGRRVVAGGIGSDQMARETR